MTTFDAPVFHWPIRVYYEDTDAGGVVYHAQYVKYLERARTEWLRAAGVEQDELLSEYGIVFAVTHIDIRYKKAARFNEALSVSVAPRQTGRARLAFEQSITRAGNPDEPLAIATVEVACVAQARFRACAVPDFLITKLSL